MILCVLFVDFKLSGKMEGIFLLKGKNGKPYQVKDDLFLGDGNRVIFGIDLGQFHRCRAVDAKPGEACLYYEWDEEAGNGFVDNYLPDGTKIFTSFSRFNYALSTKDIDKERHTKGLFVGGGLATKVDNEGEGSEIDETGMAFNDGNRWYHLWCNVNEGLASGTTLSQVMPIDWEFIGSKVLNASRDSLALSSIHMAKVDGVPLRIKKFAYFKAGEPYFIMSIWVRNMGGRPASFYYVYGDEPWVGDFGDSSGNVGWVKGSLIKYVQFIDTDKYGYVGYFDYGNDVLGKGHDFTMTANFIEWYGKEKPMVYFSNGPTDFPRDENAKVPLQSNERYVGLQWGPYVLAPRERVNIVLAIGMARLDPMTGFPVKPPVRFSDTEEDLY